jgi:hypothetical protein
MHFESFIIGSAGTIGSVLGLEAQHPGLVAQLPVLVAQCRDHAVAQLPGLVSQCRDQWLSCRDEWLSAGTGGSVL